jgi:hypothetical protein
MRGRLVLAAALVASTSACVDRDRPSLDGGASVQTQAQPVELSASAVGGCASVYATPPVALTPATSAGTMADVIAADMDGDGFTDLVVARGNDTSAGNLQVLFGPFDGGPSATWTSDAAANYRRLAVADVDHDGYLDIAAAIQAPAAQENSPKPGRRRLQSNVYRCDGGLGIGSYPSANAALVAADGGSPQSAVAVFRNRGREGPRDFGSAPSQSFSFKTDAGAAIGALSVDFGDYNGDGYADLAVGAGNPTGPMTVPVTILVNDGGVLRAEGAWKSTDHIIAYSVRFVDVDGDGLVDLFATTDAPPWGLIFHGQRAGAATSLANEAAAPTGTATYPACTAVVAMDTLPTARGSLVVGAPNGKSRICAKKRLTPILALLRTPEGTSAVDGAGLIGADLAVSARLADVDGDQTADLILGTWSPLASPDCAGNAEPTTAGPLYAVCDLLDGGPPMRLGGDAGPVFFTQGMSLGDLDHASQAASSFTACSGRNASGFAIAIPDPHLPVVTGVTVDGRPLSSRQYLAVPGSRLVYVAGGFTCSSPPTVSYTYSNSLDIVVADMTTSNIYAFMHR